MRTVIVMLVVACLALGTPGRAEPAPAPPPPSLPDTLAQLTVTLQVQTDLFQRMVMRLPQGPEADRDRDVLQKNIVVLKQTLQLLRQLQAQQAAAAPGAPAFPPVALPPGLTTDGARNLALELLRTYAPTGLAVVERTTKLPAAFAFGSTSVRLAPCPDFARGLTGATMPAFLADVSLAVNTMAHEYQSRMALATLAEKQTAPGKEQYRAYFLGDATLLVKQTPTFPAREMQGLFPPELRTDRFATYVFPSGNINTQTSGVYGLLDEFNAYYLSTRTAFDFLPYFQAAPAPTADSWLAAFTLINRQYFAGAEFKLAILNYLRYAKEKHPDVYAGLLANAGFKQAVLEIDARYGKLVADYHLSKDRIFAQLRAGGYTVSEDDEFLRIGKDGAVGARSNFQAQYRLLTDELTKPVYAGLMAELRK